MKFTKINKMKILVIILIGSIIAISLAGCIGQPDYIYRTFSGTVTQQTPNTITMDGMVYINENDCNYNLTMGNYYTITWRWEMGKEYFGGGSKQQDPIQQFVIEIRNFNNKTVWSLQTPDHHNDTEVI